MTKLMEYTFMDRHDRMEALRESDIDRYFRILELSVDESEDIARLLMYAAYFHGCVLIRREGHGTQWHYLHKSPKYGNDLQLTTWDEYGPVSDERIREAEDFSYLMNGTVSAYVGSD